MHRFFLLLMAAVLAALTIAIPHSLTEAEQKEPPRPSCAASIPADKGALMRAFGELAWIVLPENPRMEFAPLTGDHAKGPYTQMRRVRAGTDMPMHTHEFDYRRGYQRALVCRSRHGLSKGLRIRIRDRNSSSLATCERLQARKRLRLLS